MIPRWDLRHYVKALVGCIAAWYGYQLARLRHRLRPPADA